jgi:pimeloyl-ACP methyl ester carboxylesterase
MPLIFPEPDQLADMTDQEKSAVAALTYYNEKDSGYSKQQATRPQTLGYGLVDSPVGQAAWIYEKMWAWTDNKGAPEDSLTMDDMLDNIMLYWLPATGASSGRIYWESFGNAGASFKIDMPTGVSVYPKEIFRASRRWGERHLSNIIHWKDMERGGHFAAWEVPDLHVREIRECFAGVR